MASPITTPRLPVFAFLSLGSDLRTNSIPPHVSLTRIVDPSHDELVFVTKVLPSNAVIILEDGAFDGFERPKKSACLIREYTRYLRNIRSDGIRILIIRRKIVGKENLLVSDGDLAVGADTVFWCPASNKGNELFSIITLP